MNGHIDKSADFEEVKVPVPWGVIAGKWWGPKTVQPAIAIHGWQDNSGTFDNLAPLLKEKGLSLFCIDLPGHGFSSHLPKGQNYYLFWDGVPILRRIVKHFGWKEITIIGHSLGGCVAFMYAAAYPDDVKKYVSIDIAGPSVRDPKKMLEAIGTSVDKFLEYEKKTVDDMPCYNYEEMINIVVDAHKGSVTREGCEIMMRRGMAPVGETKRYLFTRDPRLKVSSLGFMTIDEVLLFASRITCEVMNIRAESGLTLDNPGHYSMILEEIEKSAKKLERHLVPGTHHLHLNNGESVASIIYDFLVS
ncbi:serine hydrolase like 2 kraken isoform X2 [Leptinotarsa decemlineata]|uniref:serine hydrolase like 2 kraken isoform X2 n=1 Tax=Leptinotarsa decemlineata TaxID=7539 RepID=UPI003D30D294